MTFKEALKLAYGAVERNGKVYIDDVEISPSNVSIKMDKSTESKVIAQKVGSLFDVQLDKGMHFEILVYSSDQIADAHVFSEWHKDYNLGSFKGYNGVIFKDIHKDISKTISHYKTSVIHNGKQTINNNMKFLTFGIDGKYGLPLSYVTAYPDGYVVIWAIRTNGNEVKVFSGNIGR